MMSPSVEFRIVWRLLLTLISIMRRRVLRVVKWRDDHL
jgi:hypothetical protein